MPFEMAAMQWLEDLRFLTIQLSVIEASLWRIITNRKTKLIHRNELNFNRSMKMLVVQVKAIQLEIFILTTHWIYRAQPPTRRSRSFLVYRTKSRINWWSTGLSPIWIQHRQRITFKIRATPRKLMQTWDKSQQETWAKLARTLSCSQVRTCPPHISKYIRTSILSQCNQLQEKRLKRLHRTHDLVRISEPSPL